MKNILLLFTNWEEGYWNTAKRAKYPNCSFKARMEAHKFRRHCPRPGIGVYTAFKTRDLSHLNSVYLKITGMAFEGNTVYFDIEPIKESKMKGSEFERMLPVWRRYANRLFGIIDAKTILEIIKTVESPPKPWVELIGMKK